MERSFKKEVASLRKGAGEVFHGEGILAVTKALLQSGVSYVGGYQGAPVSHLVDVLLDARDILETYGVHVESCGNEAGAAAMLGASINYPIRGAVAWKAIVGTNVASDALSNLSSSGVTGGALIVVGEDYGEGASVIQERSHAFALKSTIWLLDPRPNLPTIVNMVEKGFELSEASHAPVMLELRIRACHVVGSFQCKDNRPGRYSANAPIPAPSFDYGRIGHPPSTYAQERAKIEERTPAAQRFIREHRLNEFFAGDIGEIGIVVQGGLYNTLKRALDMLGLGGAGEATRVPVYCLNVTHPLVPEEIVGFAAGKRALLVVEEGYPKFIQDGLDAMLRRAGATTTIHGEDCLASAGEYTNEVMLRGLKAFLARTRPAGVDAEGIAGEVDRRLEFKKKAQALIGPTLPTRPPAFCTGCPERPVFSAIKLVEKELGPTHISADIGCHAFVTLPPFSAGNTILGYGLSVASAAGIAPNFAKRTIAIMGDGGFWHNGITSGIAGSVLNRGDGVLVVMKNGYTSATGWQTVPSSERGRAEMGGNISIEGVLRALGIKWLRRVRTYDVREMMKTLAQALTTKAKGLKVIIADGECQLARQRRVKPETQAAIAAGKRVIETRYGVDEEICTGDHACIRLSGCPSLTVKPATDKLKLDPVAHVNAGCLGCGLCGEVAIAAGLCPSFYKADVVRNPSAFDRWWAGLRARLIARIAGKAEAPPPLPQAAE
ncbi:MAG: indolepyruvate ferredoxin oxidoreductase subunit alpha [Alphaproteobacteria bacterium]|nr:indolepyruvate ferredoxin oxidoreductase subunit alpha [Alphaproteobacteria bacterium]